MSIYKNGDISAKRYKIKQKNQKIPEPSYLFREKKLKLYSQLPVSTRVRLFHIVICTNLTVHRLLANSENFTDTTPERDRPPVMAISFPISGYNWR